jgi:hypothetical protein
MFLLMLQSPAEERPKKLKRQERLERLDKLPPRFTYPLRTIMQILWHRSIADFNVLGLYNREEWFIY